MRSNTQDLLCSLPMLWLGAHQAAFLLAAPSWDQRKQRTHWAAPLPGSPSGAIAGIPGRSPLARAGRGCQLLQPATPAPQGHKVARGMLGLLAAPWGPSLGEELQGNSSLGRLLTASSDGGRHAGGPSLHPLIEKNVAVVDVGVGGRLVLTHVVVRVPKHALHLQRRSAGSRGVRCGLVCVGRWVGGV